MSCGTMCLNTVTVGLSVRRRRLIVTCGDRLVRRKGTDMPLPQDIRPVFQDIQDTLVGSDGKPALGHHCITGKRAMSPRRTSTLPELMPLSFQASCRSETES